MPIFVFISIFVPLVIAFGVPKVLKFYGYKDEVKYRAYLYVACVLFLVSWYLPSPLIDGQDTSFVTHFVGGGIFTGLIWIYLKKSLHWRGFWLVEAFSLFSLVSALGCINELAELAMVKTGIAQITLSDTSWDILANTMGALLVYLAYLALKDDEHDSRH